MKGQTEYTLPVFLITRTGVNYTDEGIRAVRNFVLGDSPDFTPEERAEIKAGLPDNTTGVLVHSGPDLLDPAGLAVLLENTPNARLVMSYVNTFAVCTDSNGTLDGIIENLKHAAEQGIDTWTMLDMCSGGKEDEEE